LRLGTFNGDFEELETLVETEWAAKYGTKTRFRYGAQWLAEFFHGPAGAKRELQLEYRDANGALVGFVGATPRRAVVNGREVRLELVTLLTAARRCVGLVAFELLREVHHRAAHAGIYGTYNCCLEGDRTPELLKYVAKSEKLQVVEVAPVPSLIGLAKLAPDHEVAGVREATVADAKHVADLFTGATSKLHLGRQVTEETVRASLERHRATRALVLLRDGVPVGACRYARRQLVGGDEVTEVANIDLLVAPDVTVDEAHRFGKAIANSAATDGANLLLAYQRVPALFSQARAAGLRGAPRTLRVFVVPFGEALEIEPGSTHLLEVE
jgi:hypothetical protein